MNWRDFDHRVANQLKQRGDQPEVRQVRGFRELLKRGGVLQLTEQGIRPVAETTIEAMELAIVPTVVQMLTTSTEGKVDADALAALLYGPEGKRGERYDEVLQEILVKQRLDANQAAEPKP
jgi:hypothetical protein